jgi:hypothetical protein
MRVLTQGEVERDIMTVVDALDSQTTRYAELAEHAAVTEADWKLAYARAIVNLSAVQSVKMTAAEKQARAEDHCGDSFRLWKIAEARRNATKEALLSLRAKLDALRSVSANIRTQT